MDDTPMRFTMPRKKQRNNTRMMIASIAVPIVLSVTSLVPIMVAEGFCPPSIITRNRHEGATAAVASSEVHHRRRPWLAISSKADYGDNEDDSIVVPDSDSMDDNSILHQQMKQADPDWYQEYVSDLLGEEYCSNRWPTIDLPEQTNDPEMQMQTQLQVEDEDETEEPIATAISSPSEISLSASEESSLEEVGDEPEEKSDANKAEDSEVVFESSPTIDTLNKEEEKSSSEEETEETSKATLETAPEEVLLSTAEVTATREEDEDDNEEPPAIDLESPSNSAVNEMQETTSMDAAEAVKPVSVIETKEVASKAVDPRALVYRNITGKAMTCVSVSNLLELGYTLPELERIQAEFLSIVVLDQRPCPSMGVPSQWKIKNPRAKLEVTMVNSMEEASAMVQQINNEEFKERDSVARRRRRKSDRQQGIKDPIRRPPNESEERDRDRDRNRVRANPADQRGRRPGSASSRTRNRPGRKAKRWQEGDGDGRGERRRRRRGQPMSNDGYDTDGNPRKIYRVPRDDVRAAQQQRDNNDPPDPDSPIWVNMDTFRNLIRKEAEFRTSLIGDDWSEVIEQENDWRTGLYQSWLWSLNDGVGESFVPPSRIERARRNQARRTPRPQSQSLSAPPSKREGSRSRSRPRSTPKEQESRRRQRQRRKGNRDDEPQQQQQPPPRQRRPKREFRNSDAGIDDDDADELEASSNTRRERKRDDEDPSISATQRRSRRRAERRRGPPGN